MAAQANYKNTKPRHMRFESKSASPRDVRVFFGDKEITTYVRSFEMKLEPDEEANTAKVDFICKDGFTIEGEFNLYGTIISPDRIKTTPFLKAIKLLVPYYFWKLKQRIEFYVKR